MAFGNTGNSKRKTFVKLSYGQFMRKNADQEWITFDTISNVHVTNIERVSKDFGKDEETLMWEFTMVDAESGDVALLSVNDGSRYANLLLNRLEGVERGQAVTLKGYNFKTPELKEIIGVTVYYSGDAPDGSTKRGKVAPQHTKDKPNNLPQARSFRGKGNKLEWDFSEQSEYYVEVFTEMYKPLAKVDLDADDAPEKKEEFDVTDIDIDDIGRMIDEA